jgi:hypothetical protein
VIAASPLNKLSASAMNASIHGSSAIELVIAASPLNKLSASAMNASIHGSQPSSL